MPKIYTWRFPVRTYEMDEYARVRLHIYQNYLDEVATQASASNGYDYAWYRQQNKSWIARAITLRYYEPATYGDELEAQTWVSNYRRVQSNREYDIRRARDGAPVLRGRTNWVYFDTAANRLTRPPEDFMTAFEPSNEVEPLDIDVHEPIAVETPMRFIEERRVQHHEIDTLHHANNAMYVLWAEHALHSIFRAAGWAGDQVTGDEVRVYPVSRQIEYLHGAREGDPLRIETCLAEVGRDRAAWRTEIRHAGSGELLAVDKTVRGFRDTHGPRSIPDDLFLALVKRS